MQFLQLEKTTVADLVHSIYKLLWSFWNAWGKSVISVKYFCIITVLHDCVPKQQASSSESNNRIYCVSSARSEVQVIYVIYEIIIFSGFSYILSDI